MPKACLRARGRAALCGFCSSGVLMPCAVLYKECVRKNGANVVKNLRIGNKMQGKHVFFGFP